VAGKSALKKAPEMWVAPHLSESVPQWRSARGSRAFLALLTTLCLLVASWFIIGLRLAVVVIVRGTANAVTWMQRVAIPSLRSSRAIRYMRRHPSEVAWYTTVGVLAVAVGCLLVAVLHRHS